MEIQTTQPITSLVSTSTRKPEAIPSTPHTKVSGYTPIRADESQAVKEMTGNSPGPVQPLSQTKNSVTSIQNQSANVQTAAIQSLLFSSKSNTSTEGMQSTTSMLLNDTSSAAMVLINQTDNSTTQATSVPPLPSITSERQGKRSTSITTNDKNLISPSLSSTPHTNLISTHKLPENNSTNAGGGATPYTSSYKTSTATTKTSSIPVTKKRREPPPNPGNEGKSNKGANHGKVVAWIIGGALVLMMVGFLIIYVKKRKIQEARITTKDWAGPSPFLEGGAGSNGQAELRSSNRISLSSFLPTRLSMRLSILQETDELEAINNSTFGDKHQAGAEDKGMGDAQKTVETHVTSSQTDDLMSKNDHTTSAPSDVGNLTQDNSANTANSSI